MKTIWDGVTGIRQWDSLLAEHRTNQRALVVPGRYFPQGGVTRGIVLLNFEMFLSGHHLPGAEPGQPVSSVLGVSQ